MLVLSRRIGESIVIGDNVVVTVSRIQGNQVRLCISAPREVSIRRSELPAQPEVETEAIYKMLQGTASRSTSLGQPTEAKPVGETPGDDPSRWSVVPLISRNKLPPQRPRQ